MSITIRPMTIADVPLGMRLKTLAGWNQTAADWHRFLRLQPDGCFVAELDGQGVGTATAFLFDNIAWIAMVLVDPDHRKHGVGTALMNQALEFVGPRTVRLDATTLGQRVYTKLGFVGEYELARYNGVLTGRTNAAAISDSPALLPPLDLQATATHRPRLLEALAAEAGAHVRSVGMTGYLLDRPGAHATQIGPVVALEEASGLALLNDAAQRLAGQPVVLDIPVNNRPAITWAEAAGLQSQRRFLRMRRGPVIADHPEYIWASSGPEKG